MQIRTVLAFLVAAAPFAAATYRGAPPPPPAPNCGPNEFHFNSWCLPSGGPPKTDTPEPPKGSNCPPTQWYWNKGKGCCTPRNPPPANPPPPQCPKDWQWNGGLSKCEPCTTPTKPPPSAPSNKPPGQPGHNDHHNDDHPGHNDHHNDYRGGPGNGHKRRSHGKARVSLCPSGLDACPISQLFGDYECLDTAVELESCGGCASLGHGQDCTQIEGAWNVGCEQGTCVVYTCAGGFALAADRSSCIPF